MEPASGSSTRITRKTAKKLEIAKDRVRKELDRCELQQEEYASHFEVASKDLNTALNTLLQLNDILDKFIDSNREFLFENFLNGKEKSIICREIIGVREGFVYESCLKPLRDLLDKYTQATNHLHELVRNLRRTCTVLTSIESRIDTMTLEELENIECPDFLWAKNNFHPNLFDLGYSAIDLRTDINRKIKIYEKRIRLLLSNCENESSTSSGSAPSTSQNSAKENVMNRGKKRTLNCDCDNEDTDTNTTVDK